MNLLGAMRRICAHFAVELLGLVKDLSMKMGTLEKGVTGLGNGVSGLKDNFESLNLRVIEVSARLEEQGRNLAEHSSKDILEGRECLQRRAHFLRRHIHCSKPCNSWKYNQLCG